jgi:hypothetical protein
LIKLLRKAEAFSLACKEHAACKPTFTNEPLDFSPQRDRVLQKNGSRLRNSVLNATCFLNEPSNFKYGVLETYFEQATIKIVSLNHGRSVAVHRDMQFSMWPIGHTGGIRIHEEWREC